MTFAFGGQRSIQLSYGCVDYDLADRAEPGNGARAAGCRFPFHRFIALLRESHRQRPAKRARC